MLDPYHMIVVNIIFFGLLIFLYATYFFVFPRKKIPPVFIVLTASLLPLISIFRAGTYESGDFNIHVYEAMSFYDALKEGVLIPHWGAQLNATYGYPVFLFSYPLPFYVISFFHFLGFSFINSMKLLLFFSFFASGITMYIFMRKVINPIAGMISSIFYLFAPYHLIILHYRVAIGELTALAILPLNFLFLFMMVKNKSSFWIVPEALAFSALILSHQAVSLLSLPVLLCLSGYLVFLEKKSIQRLLSCWGSLLAGMALSAYYWVPVLYAKQFTVSGLTPPHISFEQLSYFFYSPWRYGFLFQGPKGELSFLIGYAHWLIIGLSVYMLCIKKQKNKFMLFLFLNSFVLFFLMQPVSKIVWEKIPFLKNIQFSYRIMTIEIFIISMLAGLSIQKIRKPWVVSVICFIAIATTMLNWGHRRVISSIDDTVLAHNIAKSTAEGEGNGQSAPKWLNPVHPWFDQEPKNHADIIAGWGLVKEISRTSIRHEYIVDAKTPLTLRENTTYFPGWTAQVNGKLTSVRPDSSGIITAELPSGLAQVVISYQLLQPYYYARILSFLSGVFLLLLFFRLNKAYHL